MPLYDYDGDQLLNYEEIELVLSGNTYKAWDEDLTYGSHYHVIGEDGNTRLPNQNGKTHFLPGEIFER